VRWRDVILDRTLLKAMIAASIIMGSHGVIMSFGAIQWEDRGISASMIGVLQAIAVSSEIVAFWIGTKLLGQRNPVVLICIGAAAAALRWTIMAFDPGVPVLVVTQLLHGISATGSILGMMLLIARRVPLALSAAAQGLNAVLLGVVLALVTAGSGLLWSYGTGAAYVTMAALAAVGMAVAWPSWADPDADSADDNLHSKETFS
jgi:PPP family 3-phenylpropionic acid transporter